MTLLLIGLITAALAIFVWSLTQRFTARRQRTDMRLEGQVLYQDTGLKSEVLVSTALGLRGKPDLLVRQGESIIPIDKKPGSKPSKPYLSQTMQLAAYCALVETTYGVRPPHGVLRFEDGDVEISYTPRLRRNSRRRSTRCERQKQHKGLSAVIARWRSVGRVVSENDVRNG